MTATGLDAAGLRPGGVVPCRRAPPDVRPLYEEAFRVARPGAAYVRLAFHPHFIMASGMPTHFDGVSGEPVAITTHVHLSSDHVTGGIAAGWQLAEMK